MPYRMPHQNKWKTCSCCGRFEWICKIRKEDQTYNTLIRDRKKGKPLPPKDISD
jgi:hypothetical protein